MPLAARASHVTSSRVTRRIALPRSRSSPLLSGVLRSALVALFAMASSPAAARPYTLDASVSTVAFRAHQDVLGHTDGLFQRFDATFDLDEKDLSSSRFEVRIETASIDTNNGKRDDHLRKEDFFDVDKHPTATFTARAVEATEGGVKVSGQFTLKGKSAPLELPLELEWSTARNRRWVRARGSFVVDRFAIGIGYKTPFYIPNIDQKVEISVDVRASAPLTVETATVSEKPGASQ